MGYILDAFAAGFLSFLVGLLAYSHFDSEGPAVICGFISYIFLFGGLKAARDEKKNLKVIDKTIQQLDVQINNKISRQVINISSKIDINLLCVQIKNGFVEIKGDIRNNNSFDLNQIKIQADVVIGSEKKSRITDTQIFTIENLPAYFSRSFNERILTNIINTDDVQTKVSLHIIDVILHTNTPAKHNITMKHSQTQSNSSIRKYMYVTSKDKT